MTQVVTHASAAFHQLHLLLVNADDAAIGVGASVKTDDKTIGKRADLHVVANAGHGAPLGNYVIEIL